MAKRFYVTTPIYYVNSVPHIGTTLTTVVADVCARYRKLRGDSVYFLTGTDENGTRILEAAEKAGENPKQFVDRISAAFADVFQRMNIGYDVFFRTSCEQHRKAAQALFELLRKNGHIYEGKYEGWYDVASETFYKESDLVDGKSPDGNEVRWISEDSWFFRLSAFEKPLLEHIESHPEFLLPVVKKNEVVSFIKQGLRDMCVSRSNPGWGVPVPGDESKVIYVWFDALINYLAATGWPDDGWEETWPADVHWMGKEIFTRFHATLWPAMLMGAGLPLPKTVIAHGWFVFGDAKMSKSKGNVIAPLELVQEIIDKTGCEERHAVDALRFILAALLPYEGDTNFTREEVDRRYNSDLANDLGNALNRSLSMVHKFAGGTVPEAYVEAEPQGAIHKAVSAYETAMSEYRLDKAVDATLELVRFLNKYIDTRAPWALAKAADPSLSAVLFSMLVCLRAAEGMVRPIMPWTADEIAAQLGAEPLTDWSAIGKTGSLTFKRPVGEPRPIFPRIDPNRGQIAPATAAVPTPSPTSTATRGPNMESSSTQSPPTAEAADSFITIDDFAKVELKIARIVEAEPIEGADKLLKLQIMIGPEKRQLVAGIRKDYDPIDLIGRQIVVVANLKPAVLRGVESQGMLLAATSEDGGAILLQPDREAPEGARVK